MKLIDSSYEIIEPKSYDLDSVFKHIELCGRVCYKSEDKITSDSATKFVDRMIKSGHTSVLEHGTIYLYREFELPAHNTTTSSEYYVEYYTWVQPYNDNPYSVISVLYRQDGIAQVYVTTNYRVIVENALEDDLKYMVDQPMDHHERRYTVRFVCDRGVSHEFVRHRHFSFSQESQRYCNYSKNKYNHEVTFCIPCWCGDLHSGNSYDMELINNYPLAETENLSPESIEFIRNLVYAESSYFVLLESGWKPQQARAVLPNACKTELIMTGFASDWEHFFELRDDSRAHPDAQKLAKPLHEEFINRKYID
jgi:thymidylate synthase (FAD)